MDNISASRIATFLSCPKKYWYIYDQELVPKEQRRFLHFDKGNYFHELAHVYYQMLDAGGVAGSDEILAYMIKRVQKDLAAMNNMDLLPVFSSITTAMTRFVKVQSPKIDSGIRIVGIESEIEHPVGDFNLFGYADLIYYREGRLRLRDHKTGEKAWTKGHVQFSNQLLFYAAILYKQTGEVPVAEINFINTHDYVKGPTEEQAFNFTSILYTKEELEIYYEDVCNLVGLMLKSKPVPMYGQHCQNCAYQLPCFLSRKGIDTSQAIATNFNKVPRGKRHEPFTESNSNGDSSD